MLHALAPMRTRSHMVGILALFATPVFAQVHADRPVMLEGTDPQDRQVIGLHDGVNATDAMNARTLQRGAYRYAEVAGGSAWQANVQPATTVVSAGLCLLLRCADANNGAVTLTVNGSSPAAVLKDGDQPLQAGDIGAGETVNLVFDGSVYQLVSARRMDRKPCPVGSVDVNGQYCIETTERDSLTFDLAAVACGEAGMRLCTWGQWYAACTQAGTLGLQNMTGNWEWTNSAANGDLSVRTVGSISCTHGGVGQGVGTDAVPRNYRCCFNR